MKNHKTDTARDYHSSTKHSWHSIRSNLHSLDWPNRPRPFKIYRDLQPIPLPESPHHTGIPALSVIGNARTEPFLDRGISKQDLASILYFSAGITKKRTYPGGEVLFRAAACTGALYSIELYVVCGDLEGLDAGIYLFGPSDSSLYPIRNGDHRKLLAQASGGERSMQHAPVVIVCTGTYWRNAWKYRARTYRHFGWDNGTILANLLAVAEARSLPARIISGFVDSEVNKLLDLDEDREVALNLIPLGHTAETAPEYEDELPELDLEEIPYSRKEIAYPEMKTMHDASSLESAGEVVAWRSAEIESSMPSPSNELIPLEPLSEAEIPKDSIEEVILRRGSTRNFARSSISFRQLSTVLFAALQKTNADFTNPVDSKINDIYLICHAVDGLDPGAYVLHRKPLALELLKSGEFREKTGYLGLEQQIPADCSAAVFFLADLEKELDRHGNRGYRVTQLEAGIMGGRLYLASYAQRLGASGLTFYDDEVTSFFSPHAAGKSAIFLVAIGKSKRLSPLT